MRSYTINLPRGLEVDIFDLPEDFEEQVEQAFREYTSGTAKAYMYVDKLGFIARSVEKRWIQRKMYTFQKETGHRLFTILTVEEIQ